MEKTITIDWDSKADLLKLRNAISSQLGRLENNHASRLEQYSIMLNSMFSIYNCDTSSLYDDLKRSNETNFYVYAHCDPMKKLEIVKPSRPNHSFGIFAAALGLTHQPFYIGKGSGNRSNIIERNETHRKNCQKIERFRLQPIVHKIKFNITEKEAFMLEDKLIDIFGLLPYGGKLSNLHEGYRFSERRLYYQEHFKAIHSGSSYLYG